MAFIPKLLFWVNRNKPWEIQFKDCGNTLKIKEDSEPLRMT